MATNSKIEWTTHTFNHVRGCDKVSAGCKNCYAEVSAPSRVAKAKGIPTWGANAARIVASESMWAEPEKWERQAAAIDTAWKHDADLAIPRPPRPRVFCASLADVFEDYKGGNVCDKDGNKVYDDLTPVRARLFDLIRRTPHLDWLLLTKRPENVMRMLMQAAIWSDTHEPNYPFTRDWLAEWGNGTPPHNVWIGTTTENQEAADQRIPELLKISATVRFLSCEPLLGAVDLGIGEPKYRTSQSYHATIDWVICGGESGANARPMHPDWARSLRDQCAAADVPFLFKQWGEWIEFNHEKDGPKIHNINVKSNAANERVAEAKAEGEICFMHVDGTKWSIPEQIVGVGRLMVKVGKKTAGRTLDGVEHTEFPTVEAHDQ